MEVVGAADCEHPSELTPRHIMHRVTEDIAEPGHRAYKLIEPGALISGADDTHLAREWSMAQTASFAPLRID